MAPTRAAPKRQNQKQATPQQAATDPLAMLTDIHARVVRIETRQARQMKAQGLDTEGQPLPSAPMIRGRR